MGKSSPSAPPPPDYAGAAVAQGAANEATARLQGRLNNPNVIGPLGSQTVTFGTPTFNQAGYDQAMSAFQANPRGEFPRESQYSGEDGFDSTGYGNAMNSWAAGRMAPTREQFTTNTNADQPTVTQTLTPAAQSTLDAQQRVQRALAGLGEQGIGTAQNVLGNAFNPNLAGLQTNVGNAGQIPQTPDLNRYGQASGLPGPNIDIEARRMMGRGGLGMQRDGNLSGDDRAGATTDMTGGKNAPPPSTGYADGTLRAPELSAYGMAGAGPQAGQYGYAQGGLNTSNVAAMPVNAGMTGQQAIMNRLAPQLERADASTRQRLINQGLVPGGEAYENAMISQNQQKNDLLSQAALQGIGLDTAANAQGFGQALQAGQYGNQAVAQNFGQGQAANAAQNASIGQNQQAALAQYQAQLGGQQQGFGQNVTQRQLGNQAISQNQQAALQQQQAALAAQNQQYNQLLQGAQFGNIAQQQSLAQQLALRNQPLNEIAGLMSGSQIQMPQFQGYQGSNVAPAPIFAGAQAAGQGAMDQYGIASSNVNAQNAGLYNLAGTAGMAVAL